MTGGEVILKLLEVFEKTQTELGEAVGLKQTHIWRALHRGDMKLELFKECVEALGGEVVIRFPEYNDFEIEL